MSGAPLAGVEVGIVGTINRDEIVTPAGERTSSLGGILYNVLAMAALLEGSGAIIRPVGRLGREDRAEAVDLLSRFSCVDASTLIADPGGTNLSFLDYSGGEERIERAELRVAPLTVADLAPLGTARLVLVNMISGRDVNVATLRSLRAGGAPRLVLDIQALARTPQAPRRPCGVADWREWAAVFDVVRGNEVEMAYFGGVPEDPDAGAAAVRAAGCPAVVVTRGERGATLWDGATRSDHPAEPAVPRLVDPTGCGDSFLSAVAAALVAGQELPEAVALGVSVSARVAGMTGLTGLARLGEAEPARSWRRGLRDPGGPTGER